MKFKLFVKQLQFAVKQFALLGYRPQFLFVSHVLHKFGVKLTLGDAEFFHLLVDKTPDLDTCLGHLSVCKPL